jgi:hypothetical protein
VPLNAGAFVKPGRTNVVQALGGKDIRIPNNAAVRGTNFSS